MLQYWPMLTYYKFVFDFYMGLKPREIVKDKLFLIGLPFAVLGGITLGFVTDWFYFMHILIDSHGALHLLF